MSNLTFAHHGEVERWLPVVGWEGLYDVSSLGRVRGVDRIASDGKHIRGRILKPHLDGLGHYLFVSLCRNGVPKIYQVHRLVAAAFIGPCPAGHEVRHGPNGKLDNRASQLCYGTRTDNMRDCIRDGTTSRGERHGGVKLTEALVAEIRRRVAAGETQTSLAAQLGVSFGTISKIIRGTRWRHVA